METLTSVWDWGEGTAVKREGQEDGKNEGGKVGKNLPQRRKGLTLCAIEDVC